MPNFDPVACNISLTTLISVGCFFFFSFSIFECYYSLKFSVSKSQNHQKHPEVRKNITKFTPTSWKRKKIIKLEKFAFTKVFLILFDSSFTFTQSNRRACNYFPESKKKHPVIKHSDRGQNVAFIIPVLKNSHYCCWSSLKCNLSWPIHSWLAGRRRRPLTPHPTLLPSPTIIGNWSVIFSDHWNYHVVKVSRR